MGVSRTSVLLTFVFLVGRLLAGMVAGRSFLKGNEVSSIIMPFSPMLLPCRSMVVWAAWCRPHPNRAKAVAWLATTSSTPASRSWPPLVVASWSGSDGCSLLLAVVAHSAVAHRGGATPGGSCGCDGLAPAGLRRRRTPRCRGSTSGYVTRGDTEAAAGTDGCTRRYDHDSGNCSRAPFSTSSSGDGASATRSFGV